MSTPFVDPQYLGYQYDDSEKLRIRVETHRLYTEGGVDLEETVLRLISPQAGMAALEVGCGTGELARRLRHQHHLNVIALDRSAGMLCEARDSESAGCFVQGDAQRLPFP